MSILKEKLSEALENKKNDINQFIWKGRKIKYGNEFVQEEIKLVDATPTQLNEFYSHCNTMLWNKSSKYPGRYIVLKNIEDQLLRCNVEVCLRNLESQGISRTSLSSAIHEELQKDLSMDTSKMIFSDIVKITGEFENLPLNMVLSGCYGQLGNFNRKHLKLAFILKQGIWLNKEEMEDFIQNEGMQLSQGVGIAELIKERLNINPNIALKISSTGLTYNQFRAALRVNNKKYSEMTTEQLETLRTRLLFNLINEVRTHIKQWEGIKTQIEIVASQRKINLV